MSPQEIDEILQRYLKDECTGKEKELVEEWFDAIGKDSGELDVPTQLAVRKKLWSKLVGSADYKQDNYWRIGRIAAALLFLAVSTFLLINYYSSTENNKASASANSANMLRFVNSGNALQRIELKDGSVISLQPGGEVNFPKMFYDKREVYLSGEAFFEVSKDVTRPFLVYANEVTTKVLGTSFLIKAYKQEKEIVVTVKTGKVSVYTQSSNNKHEAQEEIMLTPNQQVIYNRNENLTVKKLVDDPQIIVQQPSLKASYTNAPVIEIFHALEKIYGIDIQYDANALSGCTLTYTDIAEEGLYEQIEIICRALGGRYKRSEFSILIEAEGCK